MPGGGAAQVDGFVFDIGDRRVSPPEICVLRLMLERQAATTPDAIYAVFGDGMIWSFADTLRHTRIAAAGLQALGVMQDDKVLIALPNGPDALRIWFAVNYLGAVAVHVNPAYRGSLLARVAATSNARLVVADSAFIARFEEIDRGQIEAAVVFGPLGETPSTLRIIPCAALAAHGDMSAPPPRPLQPFDLQCIIYTSGTTGPSKGVMCSYQHIFTAGRAVYFMTGQDRYLVNLPMYHVSGILPCVLMLGLGGSVAVIERFRAADFWQTVADTKPTFVILLSVMMGYLLALPPSDLERRSSIRKIIAQPLDNDALRLRARFGFDVYTSFNMTEISIPIISEPNPTAIGSCGRLRPGVEARIVDANDREMPTGEVGELILRTDQPWAMTHGYYGDAEATARAWRNGWFHTGDAFRVDADGLYTFVDRIKDTIRRRGENISSFEVEAETIAHPMIREAAAVGVPSALSESEVMVVVSLIPGGALDPAELISFLQPRLPYFMIPRYVRIIAELPKTPTQKIEKHALRAQGVTADVWDREKAGIRILRDDLARA